jgi:serine/threonine protein phosphatase 1
MVFCHAGVDRDRPLSRQDLGTLTWIREPFLDRVGKRHHVVVHGHTIFDDGPVVTENRVSLDTGAYWTGVLSAFMIMPSKRLVSFPQATGGTSNVEVEEIAPRLLDRGEGTAMDRLGEVFEGWKGDSEVSA